MAAFLVFLGIVVQMWNVQLFWNWFVVPMGVPPLAFPQAAAFVILAGSLATKLVAAVTIEVYPAVIFLLIQFIVLCIGYGLSMFM